MFTYKICDFEITNQDCDEYVTVSYKLDVEEKTRHYPGHTELTVHDVEDNTLDIEESVVIEWCHDNIDKLLDNAEQQYKQEEQRHEEAIWDEMRLQELERKHLGR